MTFEDTFDIAQSATFGSAGGIDLVNIQHLQNYVKIARKIDTPVDDYIGNDSMSQLYKCNSLAADNPLPFKYRGGDVNPGTHVTALTNTPKDNYVDVKYINTTTRCNAEAADAITYAHRQFPLGAIPGTLFAVDRDFYSPVEQYLRITAGVGDKIAFTTKVANEKQPDVEAFPIREFVDQSVLSVPCRGAGSYCLQTDHGAVCLGSDEIHHPLHHWIQERGRWSRLLQPTFRFRSASSMVSASSASSTPYGILLRS